MDEQFEDLYGPEAAYSALKRGERITYRVEGAIRSGKIVWVAAPTVGTGREIPKIRPTSLEVCP